MFLLIIFSSCNKEKNINEILNGKFVFVTIPQNDSIETEFNQKQLKKLLVLLHNRVPESEIKNLLGLNNIQYQEKINQLFGSSLIKKKEDGSFVPTCMIIDTINQRELKNIASPIGKLVAEIVIDRLPLIKSLYLKFLMNNSQKGKTLTGFSFDEISLFLLSNVILNEWQLKNIQEKFIKSHPPSRERDNYYAALFQLDNYNSINVFLNRSILNDNYLKKFYSKIIKENDFVYPSSYNYIKIPYEKKYEKLFENMASIVAKDLIENLEKKKPLLVKYFLNSVYKDEISFREWLMWVYQFIVTEATEYLIKKDIIKEATNIYFVQSGEM